MSAYTWAAILVPLVLIGLGLLATWYLERRNSVPQRMVRLSSAFGDLALAIGSLTPAFRSLTTAFVEFADALGAEDLTVVDRQRDTIEGDASTPPPVQ